MSIFIVLDTTSRDLAVYTANVTKTKTGGLVIRQALAFGDLWSLEKGLEGNTLEMPLLIVGDGYRAQSSAGFVNVVVSDVNAKLKRAEIVGFLSFSGPLMKVGNRIAGVSPAGAKFERVKTFSNFNSASAKAASDGFDLLVRVSQNSVLIAEGQSNTMEVLKIVLPLKWETPQFGEEYHSMFDQGSDEEPEIIEQKEEDEAIEA